MRTMIDKYGYKMNVLEWFMLANGWEYYVTEKVGKDGIGFGLVCGFVDELGSFYMPELQPYLISSSQDLSEVMPAPGCTWQE